MPVTEVCLLLCCTFVRCAHVLCIRCIDHLSSSSTLLSTPHLSSSSPSPPLPLGCTCHTYLVLRCSRWMGSGPVGSSCPSWQKTLAVACSCSPSRGLCTRGNWTSMSKPSPWRPFSSGIALTQRGHWSPD